MMLYTAAGSLQRAGAANSQGVNLELSEKQSADQYTALTGGTTQWHYIFS